MARLLVAEWMKSRTRWLPYVLFIIMVLGAGVQVWLFGYTAWWDLHDETDPDLANDLPLAIRTFTLPWALPQLIDSGQFWGALIIGIFISSAVATEYNWGTVRHAVARGQSREQWLTVKLFGLALFCAALLLVVLAWGVVSMIITSNMAGFDVSLQDGRTEIDVFDIVLTILRAAMGILPYALLAFALAVIGRSTALGAAGIILFMIIESTLIPVFGSLSDPWPAFRSATIGHNVAALLRENRIEGGGDYASIAPREALDPGEGPDAWVAFVVLCVWCAGLLGATYYVFRRRDLRLGTGE